jgi:hypothetical protein
MLKRPSSATAFVLTILAWGCDKSETDKSPPPSAAAPSENKAPDDHKVQAHPMPGQPPHGAHGQAPGGPPPHGMMAPAPPKGPPRDIEPSGENTPVTLGHSKLVLEAPKEWERTPPSSGMRLAQFTIPGPGGDGELVVYQFPGGGDVQSNIERWKGQFKPPEGKSIDEVAKTDTFTAGSLKVSVLDVSGRYVASVPGAPAYDEPDYRMLAAVIEGEGDPLFLKATGPAKTMSLWDKPFDAMLHKLKRTQ